MTTPMKTGYGSPAMNYFGAPQIAWDKPDDSGADAEAAAAAAKAGEEEAARQAEAAKQAEAEAAAKAAADDLNKDKEDLAAEKAALLKEVMSKKDKLKETSDALAAAQEELAKFKGVDPAKYAALLKAQTDAETAEAEAKGDFDRVKQMMAEAHKAELAAKDEEIERLRNESSSAAKMIDGLTIGNDFASSEFIAKNMTLSPTKARVIYGGHFETKDGKTVGYDKPAGQAGRTLLVNSSGDPLAFDEAIKKIVEADPDKNSVLKANLKPGSAGKTTDVEAKQKAKDTENVPYGRELIAQQFFKNATRP